jgi:Domain of unknown function (DUF3784)
MADVGLYNLVSLLLVVCGYLIKYKRKLRLIAGYDARKVRDPAGLADWVGTNLLALAVCAFLIGALTHMFPGLSAALSALFVVAVVGTCLYTTFGAQRFTHASTGQRRAPDIRRELAAPAAELPSARLDARARTPSERVVRAADER